MQTLIGLYIEDEPKNVELYQARFSFYGIKLIGMAEYPPEVTGFHDVVVENNVDFLLVDHELDKASVSYKGIDVLREIRRYDDNIYAVLITNYPLEDYKGELGEYDFQLMKGDLADSEKFKELAAKIKRACTLRKDNDILASMEARQDELQNLLQKLNSVIKKD